MKKPSKPKNQPTLNFVPVTGRAVAFVVGIEEYQPKVDSLPSVTFARDDAKAIAEIIPLMYPDAQCRVELLLDSDATHNNLQYLLVQTIGGLNEDDLFIFYYAGHGYHGAGGNRITAWDTHAHNLDGTSLLLRNVLSDPLTKSACQRAIAFVDACATALDDVVDDRNIFSALDKAELNELLAHTHFSALYLSCEPGQKSYPSALLKHGIWTSLLLKALRGDAKEALTEDRLLTDVTLRDYLRIAVPRFITKNMQIKATQKPTAIINATNTFVIREIPLPPPVVDEAGDFSKLKVRAKREYFEHVETGAIRALPGFNKKIHFVPEVISSASRDFISRLLTPKVDEEIQQLYEQAKDIFKLRRKNTDRTSGGGQGSLDTEYFRFWIESHQSKNDPGEYALARRLELREEAAQHLDALGELFGPMFDRVVIQFEGVALDYDDLVDMLEDIVEQHGGEVKDDENQEKVTYHGADGTSFMVDFKRRRLRIFWRVKKGVPDILEQLRGLRLGLPTPGRLLVG